MRKVVNVSKKKHWYSAEPDLELLNQQLEEVEKDGWNVISIVTNCNLFGAISSYSLLLEHTS